MTYFKTTGRPDGMETMAKLPLTSCHSGLISVENMLKWPATLAVGFCGSRHQANAVPVNDKMAK